MRSPPPISRLKCDCACDKPFGTPIAQDSLMPDYHFLMLRAEGIADSVDPMLIPIGAETATTQYRRVWNVQKWKINSIWFRFCSRKSSARPPNTTARTMQNTHAFLT